MSAGGAAGTALASGVALAVVVLLVAAIEIVARSSWRARFRVDHSGAWGSLVAALVTTVAATAAAAGLAVAAVAVLAQVGPDDSEPVIWAWVAASMAVVAAATVVAALWAGPTVAYRSVVAVLVAVPPVSAAAWVEVMKDPDPQAPIAGFLLTTIALAVSGGVCALVRRYLPHSGAGRAR